MSLSSAGSVPKRIDRSCVADGLGKSSQRP